MNVSKTQVLIEKSGKGYRSETAFSGNESVFRNILEYEMLELGNMDIPTFINEYFCSCLSENTKSYYERKFNCKELFDLLEEAVNGTQRPVDLRNKVECNALLDFMVQIVRDSSFHAYSGELYACWLTTASACKLYYGSDVCCYSLPKRYVCVADLGAEGVLMVSTEKINSEKNRIKVS